MERVLGTIDASHLEERLHYLAWRRYGIAHHDAEDLVQAALLTYLEVRDRYPRPEEHARILTGIFRNKCREHIESRIRADRKLRTLQASLEGSLAGSMAATVPARAEGEVLDELVRRECLDQIRGALEELRSGAREMFRLILEENASRKDLIERYGLNKNTLDSRLHAYRRELRTILTRRGLDA